MNLVSVHPARGDDWVSDWWSPYEGCEYSRIGGVYATLFALRLDDRTRLDSAPWSLPRTLSGEEFIRVLDAEHAIAKVQDTVGTPNAMLRVIQAWCSAVAAVRNGNADRTREAGRRYAQLARDPELSKELFNADSDTIRKFPAWSAAILFRTAGDLDSVREMSVLWTSVDKESPDGWRFRAEVERQIGIDEWADSYEKYIQLSSDTDTSWEHSELLRLLLESRDRNAADRALRALALEHADRPVVEEMLTWDWAAYSHLDESTRHRWWDGLVFICDGRVREAFRRAPWRYAAACFGEAVASELRVRIFGPLALTAGLDRHAATDRERRLAWAILKARNKTSEA